MYARGCNDTRAVAKAQECLLKEVSARRTTQACCAQSANVSAMMRLHLSCAGEARSEFTRCSVWPISRVTGQYWCYTIMLLSQASVVKVSNF